MSTWLLIGLSLGFTALSAASAAGLRPVNLRCEYHTDPAGLGERAPRLSWRLETSDPARRGQAQSAYQIVAASSPDALDAADLWDSGRVDSNATNQIVYAGKPLASRQRVWWKVRAWDDRGDAGDWSAPARWSMGLLDAGDWSAKWIGYDAPDPEADDGAAEKGPSLAGTRWMWLAADDGGGEAASPPRFFRKIFDLPADRRVVAARLTVTADDRLTLYVNGVDLGGADTWRELHRFDLTNALRGGANALAIRVENDPSTPGGLVGRLEVAFDRGGPLRVDVDESWHASTGAKEGWQAADFDDAKWPAATAVAAFGEGPWGEVGGSALRLPPPPQLRKAFTSDKPVRRATLYATALGLYDLRLNGRRVGDVELAPGWTDYRKRVYYHAYDATDLVRGGENVIATVLADGWYAGYVGFDRRREIYGDRPRLLAQLEIEYGDGTTQTVATDGSWRAAYGPVREADLLMGCAYDARRESDWTSPGFDDSAWRPAAVGEDYDGLVQAYPGAPVRRQEEIVAAGVRETRPGVYVFDLKQNMVGWARIAASGKAGQTVTVRYAEALEADDTLYTIALRGARATDFYTPAADGAFAFEPSFTFHGFRYVEVSGLTAPPTADAVTGVVVHADMPRSGAFAGSSPAVNQLFHNIVWGQKGNYLEVPTDCPQRDERLGWTGDAQFFIPTAAFNFDVAAFFTKWLVDLDQDAQRGDGAYASVAPDVTDWMGAGSSAWADAGIICPYNIWKYYGDTRVIGRHYESMSRYVDYLQKTSNDHLRGQGDYGDWVNLGGGAKSEVIGTAYVEHVARLMSEMAAAIGKREDAAAYRRLADDTRAAFIKSFVGDDGRIEASSQTGYALAFTMNLLPDDRRAAAADHFVHEIEAKDWHLATGFIGTPRLLPALTDAGRTDVAYRLLLTDTYPSWLYQVRLGATTMWERWDGWTPEKGFQTPVMNSFNHYAFGSVGQWMYETAAGIETDGPGFRRVTIRPRPGPGLTAASARYDSINGTVESAWRIDGGEITLDVTVPPNVTATVYVPTSDATDVTEGGEPANDAEGVTPLKGEGQAAFRVGSGTYHFVAPRAR